MSEPPGLRVRVVDGAEFGAVAADTVCDGAVGPGTRLGVATGGSPLSLYRELARRTARGKIDLSSAVLIALDEYVGLGPEDPHSYTAYVHSTIAGPLRIPGTGVVVPDGSAPDPEVEATALEDSIIDLGGVDIQILGLGSNGHIGFNEPGTPFDSGCHVVTLSERTRTDNARFFGGHCRDVPARAITQGLGTISRARSIVLLAIGSHKAAALAAAVCGPVSTDVPASVLQRHPDVTVVADRAAAGHL